MDKTDFYLWLIAHHHSAHLRWIVVWLTGAISVSNVIIQVALKSLNINYYDCFSIFIVFFFIISGMSFSIYRLTKITVKQMIWYKELNKMKDRHKLPTEEIFIDRGRIQKYFVSDEGKECTNNMRLFIIIQDLILVALFLIAFFL